MPSIRKVFLVSASAIVMLGFCIIFFCLGWRAGFLNGNANQLFPLGSMSAFSLDRLKEGDLPYAENFLESTVETAAAYADYFEHYWFFSRLGGWLGEIHQSSLDRDIKKIREFSAIKSSGIVPTKVVGDAEGTEK